MNGTETALAQGGVALVSLTGIAAIIKWSAPYILKLGIEFFKGIQAQRLEVVKAKMDLEIAKKQNTDEAINANRAMVQVLQTALNSVNGRIDSLQTSLTHTDGKLSQLISYMPTMEKMRVVLEQIENKRKAQASNPVVGKESFPEQEHIVKGDMHIIKAKPPKKDGEE